ncbi:MAG: hypothetical protein GEU83_11855 [Pseudonocardiaceae bacterium]|nr:hypothetical protein [Pseudonocardiaceae bacterium]
MEVIAFPDTEDLLVDYLTEQLPRYGDTATAHVQIPNPRRDRFVVVPRVGGPVRNLVVDEPTIGVECWAATPVQAFGLARLVRGLLHALPGHTVAGVPFYSYSEFTGPTNLPDPESGQARYILTAALTVRGAAL